MRYLLVGYGGVFVFILINSAKQFSRIFTIESGRLGEMANQNTNEGATQGSIES